MVRFLALSCFCIFATPLLAAEPNDRVAKEVADIKCQLAQLSHRLAEIENATASATEDAGSIRFDRLRVPYNGSASRSRAHDKIVASGRETLFSGAFSPEIGWEQISVEDATEIEAEVVQSAVATLPVGRLSVIYDSGDAFYLLRVTAR